jgi:hypothetical protein
MRLKRDAQQRQEQVNVDCTQQASFFLRVYIYLLLARSAVVHIGCGVTSTNVLLGDTLSHTKLSRTAKYPVDETLVIDTVQQHVKLLIVSFRLPSQGLAGSHRMTPGSVIAPRRTNNEVILRAAALHKTAPSRSTSTNEMLRNAMRGLVGHAGSTG